MKRNKNQGTKKKSIRKKKCRRDGSYLDIDTKNVKYVRNEEREKINVGNEKCEEGGKCEKLFRK
jgi:hypothetical protein